MPSAYRGGIEPDMAFRGRADEYDSPWPEIEVLDRCLESHVDPDESYSRPVPGL